MAPVNTKFDYLVIGGGSGGVASARRAASYGAKVLLVESKFDKLGGTCVNVGCVPKKVMWHAADLAEKRKHLKSYGLSATQDDVKYGDFDWNSIKVKRDAYVRRLNGIYKNNLIKENVNFVFGFAKFINSEGDVEVSLTGDQEIPFLEEGKEFKKDEKLVFAADKILLATGGEPIVPPNVEGKELGIVSDGFFELEQQPKKVAIVGSGYIGTEFAGVFSSLGSETHIILRSDAILRHFDESIQENVTAHYVNDLGVKIHYKVNVSKIEKTSSGTQKVHLTDGKVLDVDVLIWTVGRRSLVDHIGLEKVNVKRGEQGHVLVDEYQQTDNPKIFSLGDVVGNVELTPVAIAAGRKLSNRLFSGKKEFAHDKLDYNFVPSVVFSHPEAGTIGLTTAEAKQKYGEENIKIYQSKFTSLYNAMMDSQDLKTATFYKLIVTGPEEKVIGLHIVGESSAEILQGFGVAIKMGATKADFDNCVAIHPTSAEELVTLK